MKHKIETVEDILNCVNEKNLDNFLKDFRNFLESYQAMLKLVRVSAEGLGHDLSGKKNTEILKHKATTWIDDGKHGVTINVGVE